MKIVEVEFEKYPESAKKLPMPEHVYSICVDEGRDVILFYEDNVVEILEAA